MQVKVNPLLCSSRVYISIPEQILRQQAWGLLHLLLVCAFYEAPQRNGIPPLLIHLTLRSTDYGSELFFQQTPKILIFIYSPPNVNKRGQG